MRWPKLSLPLLPPSLPLLPRWSFSTCVVALCPHTTVSSLFASAEGGLAVIAATAAFGIAAAPAQQRASHIYHTPHQDADQENTQGAKRRQLVRACRHEPACHTTSTNLGLRLHMGTYRKERNKGHGTQCPLRGRTTMRPCIFTIQQAVCNDGEYFVVVSRFAHMSPS